MSQVDEYDLGYYEGMREVARLYNRCLMQIIDETNGNIQLMLDSEAFTSLLATYLEEAKELRDRNES
jgi:hypothetical protein